MSLFLNTDSNAGVLVTVHEYGTTLNLPSEIGNKDFAELVMYWFTNVDLNDK